MRLATMTLAAVVSLAITTQVAGTQQPPTINPTFDVVSVKRNTGSDLNSRFEFRPDGGLSVLNLPLRTLVARAFPDLLRFPMVGLPAWAAEERYDVDARASVGLTSPDTQAAMLRALLADRFKLAFHVEQREHEVYELVLARSDGRLGAGLKLSDENIDCEARAAAERAAAAAGQPLPKPPMPSRADLNGTPPPCTIYTRGPQAPMEGTVTMSGLALWLGGSAGRVVIDRTGLRGMYHIVMQYDLMAGVRGPAAAPSPDAPPSVFTAVQEQLGLRLRPARVALDTLVIDRVERPTDN